MRTRNFSPQTMFQLLAQKHSPRLQFEMGHDFWEWKSKTKSAVLATLGRIPESVAPDPEMIIEWKDRGLLKRRYVIDVGADISAVLQVNFPDENGKCENRPAIMCWHGHGSFGKEPVMGNVGSAEMRATISSGNYDYGHQMALKGFVTYAIDWMGFGDRNDQRKPNNRDMAQNRDWCNLYYLHATLFGMTNLGINLAHGRAATDFVCLLPEVDPTRLGVMGLSGGGTMTLWTALTDDRFSAAEIICYSDLWAKFGIRDMNYCGSQIAPGLYELVDVPDLQGLLAPMPLLVDIGVADECFLADGAMECFRKVEKIYEAAGARDRLELDLTVGGHAWGGTAQRGFSGRG